MRDENREDEDYYAHQDQLDDVLVEVDAQIKYFNAESSADVDLTPMEGLVPLPLPVVDTVHADLAELFGDDALLSTTQGEWSAVGREESVQTRRGQRDEERQRECPIERESWARGGPPLQPLGRILKRIRDERLHDEPEVVKEVLGGMTSSTRSFCDYLPSADLRRNRSVQKPTEIRKETRIWKWTVVGGGHEADVESEADGEMRERIVRRRKKMPRLEPEVNQEAKEFKEVSDVPLTMMKTRPRQYESLSEMDGRAPVLQGTQWSSKDLSGGSTLKKPGIDVETREVRIGRAMKNPSSGNLLHMSMCTVLCVVCL